MVNKAALTDETLLHQEAFEFYYTTGAARNLKQVGQKFGVSSTTAGLWSTSFNWQERIKLRDIENARKLQQKSDSTIISTKANYRKIIQASIGTFVKELKENKITVKSIKDVVDLMHLDLELLGEVPQEEIRINIEDAVYATRPDKETIENANNKS